MRIKCSRTLLGAATKSLGCFDTMALRCTSPECLSAWVPRCPILLILDNNQHFPFYKMIAKSQRVDNAIALEWYR